MTDSQGTERLVSQVSIRRSFKTQYVDRVANVILGGDRAVSCRRANQVALGYVPGVVMFNLAGSEATLAVPIVRQRSATTHVTVMFRSHSNEHSERFKKQTWELYLTAERKQLSCLS